MSRLNREEFDRWVVATTQRHLDKLLADAREYAKLNDSYVTPHYLVRVERHAYVFGDFNDEAGIMEIPVPRAWFIEPQFRKLRTAELQKALEEKKHKLEAFEERRIRQQHAGGYIQVIRELEGEQAAEEARQHLIREGWLEK